MRVATVFHQQISQIKWHVLACTGLIMVLPLEEAVTNLLEKDGFYATWTVIPSVILGPLLAGLIACANVQGDMEDRRYAFWRSKPVGLKRFMTIKYLTGLVLAMSVQACPMLFAAATIFCCGERLEVMTNTPGRVWLFPVSLSLMVYSICFACNVFIRNTARSWLIGMAAACLLLLMPFVVPLGYKDVVGDTPIWVSGLFMGLMFAVTAGALLCAVLAVQHDWHLKTNLKGLLCMATAVVFALMFVTSRQVANIKVLDEIDVSDPDADINDVYAYDVAGRVILSDSREIEVRRNRLFLKETDASSEGSKSYLLPHVERKAGYVARNFFCEPPFQKVGDQYLAFSIYAERADSLNTAVYGRPEEVEMWPTEMQEERFFEVVEVRSYRLGENGWEFVSSLNISDRIRRSTYISVCFLNGKVLARTTNQYVAVDVSNGKDMRLLDVADFESADLRELHWGIAKHKKEVVLPAAKLKGLTPTERVQMTLLFTVLQADFSDGRIVVVDTTDKHTGFARYEMMHFANETAYFELTGVRPVTVFERIGEEWGYGYNTIVRDGRMYVHNDKQLLVFDIHSRRRIRKIGHFVRLHQKICQVLLLDSGDILLIMQQELHSREGLDRCDAYLCLLKAP